MAKKKRKTFPKSKLLSLFTNKNYQKVISKIKQFAIEDMQSDEVEKIELESLQKLSQERFEAGDLQRAVREIERAIEIKADENSEFLKLKYLCYLEHFEDAKSYAEELLQKYKSSKRILFYALLVELYLGNSIDAKELKKLSKTRQEYLLALSAIFHNDAELALQHLSRTKPRAKVEKNSIEALQAILLQKIDFEIKEIKPLYKFLLFGDDANLYESKSVRKYSKEIKEEFKYHSTSQSLKRLLTQKGYIDDAIVRKEHNPKLTLNNIVLMLEKQSDPEHEEIYKIFKFYKKDFVMMLESIYPLMRIMKNMDISSVGVEVISFVTQYLELHGKKLAPFTRAYILNSILFFDYTNKKQVRMVEALFDTYGNKEIYNTHIVFTAINHDTLKLYEASKESVNHFFAHYSHINEIIVRNIVEFVRGFGFSFMFLDIKSIKNAVEKLNDSLVILKNLQEIDKGYKTIFLRLLNGYAIAVSTFDADDLKNWGRTIIYDSLTEVLKKYKAYFGYERSRFCEVAEEFLYKEDDDEDDFDYYASANVAREKYHQFKSALERGSDPFVTLEDYPQMYVYFHIEEYETAVFDLIMEYARFQELDDAVIAKIFKLTHFEYRHEFVRTRLQTILSEYAKEHPEIAQKIFKYILKTTNAQSVWYLNWLYSYMDMVDTRYLKKDDFFYKCIDIFLEIQKRKRFKTTQKRYDLVIERFVEGDVEDMPAKPKQKTFEF